MKRLIALAALAALFLAPASAPAELPANYDMWTSDAGQIRVARHGVADNMRLRVEDSAGNVAVVQLDDSKRIDLIMMLIRAAP